MENFTQPGASSVYAIRSGQCQRFIRFWLHLNHGGVFFGFRPFLEQRFQICQQTSVHFTWHNQYSRLLKWGSSISWTFWILTKNLMNHKPLISNKLSITNHHQGITSSRLTATFPLCFYYCQLGFSLSLKKIKMSKKKPPWWTSFQTASKD